MFAPKGWLLPVTPGSQFVTIGSAIANDVHGKNHHVAGSFCDHVKRIQLIRTDGTVINCGPYNSPDWFYATVGGLGLTGLISVVEIQLKKVTSPWLDVETIPFGKLDEFSASLRSLTLFGNTQLLGLTVCLMSVAGVFLCAPTTANCLV